MVRFDQFVDRDRFGIVHSEQDIDGGINAHVMDKGADGVIAYASIRFMLRKLCNQ